MSTSHKKVDRFVDKVQQAVRNGDSVNLYKKQREVGYSHNSAKAYKGVNSKTYKQRMKPFLEELKAERDRILEAMADRDLSDERYDVLNKALKDTTKNVQLLGGKATENVEFRITEGANNDRIDGKDKEYIDKDGDTKAIHDVEPEKTGKDTSKG